MKGSKVMKFVANAYDTIGAIGVGAFITMLCIAINKNDNIPKWLKTLGYASSWVIGLLASDKLEAYGNELSNAAYETEKLERVGERLKEENVIY
jgi:hypothetical protein